MTWTTGAEPCPGIRGLIWWPPNPEPDPHPDWLGAYQLGLASRLAVALSQATDPKLEATLTKALDHCLAELEKTLG